VPAPNSTIVSILSQGKFSSILFVRKEELGVILPILSGFERNLYKKTVRVVIAFTPKTVYWLELVCLLRIRIAEERKQAIKIVLGLVFSFSESIGHYQALLLDISVTIGLTVISLPSRMITTFTLVPEYCPRLSEDQPRC